MALSPVRGVDRRRLIGWSVAVLAAAGLTAAAVPVVKAGLDHAGAVPAGAAPGGALGPPLRDHLVHGGWQAWFTTIPGVVGLTVALLPLAALAVWALARRRSAAGDPRAWRTSLAEVGIVYGTVPWVWLTMLPGGRAGEVAGRVSLVPLRDLHTMTAGGTRTAIVQVGGNLLVLAALGFFAPLRFAKLASVPRILALGAACSALIEVAQYALRLDRVSSVDDVLLNAAGAGLAALASRHWWRRSAGTRLTR
ncbi:VanZ family protein [Hamadaea tsunoensis]|uniref:VanZ family protein n=1 Tax=Hamadaea tsunoensis TaxID=53368 RepID=UPI000408EF93|nr:VanZ family protein [Hamadaea tsunoensis]